MLDRGTRPEYMRLLDPDALAKIHRLELLARGVVEGFISRKKAKEDYGFEERWIAAYGGDAPTGKAAE